MEAKFMEAVIRPRWSKNRFDLDTAGLSVGAREIASWLSDDVGTKDSADEWIRRFEPLVRTGGRGYMGTGNAHNVGAISNYIFLECEFVENQKVLANVKDLILALMAYKEFLSVAKTTPGNEPMPFEVRYEKEGEAALRFYLDAGGRLGLTQEEIDEDTKEMNE
jgi:hypothetical protein